MRSYLAVALFVWLPLRAEAQEDQEQPRPRVERVEIQGNQYLQKDTLRFYISTKPGDDFDEFRLREDFRRLWETGFLNDLRVDALDTPQGGKVAVFTVQERRRIQIVDYRGSKAVSKTNLEDELKKRDATLRIDSFYDLAKARKVEEIIRGMLSEKGRSFGTVKHEARNLGGAGVQVTFTIDDGPPAKVRTTSFEGNQAFSDGKLRGRMKRIKPVGFWNLSWLTGKTKFSAEKWTEDQEKLREHYLNHGYAAASVGQPTITYTDGKSGFFRKKPVKWVHLSIPVNEGDRYRVGDVRFEGLSVFKEEAIRPLFKLKAGDAYNDSKLRKAYDKLRDAYGAQGFFQWTGFTERKPDPERKVVDLVLHMEEDKRFYVGKIGFAGNHSTRDKVIRREVYLTEGEVFNTELLKLTIRRLNQLGYFKPLEGPPQLAPNPRAEDKIDLTFKLEEQNRNQFTFGGGVSGLEGTFINASFSTANFLGRGETVTVMAQTGARSRNYQFAITEPYLFDRSITGGFDVFLRRQTYLSYGTSVGYGEQSQGVSLTSGIGVSRFSRLFASYSYQIIDIYDVDERALGDQTTSTGVAPASQGDASLLGRVGRRHESGIGTSWVRNTVDGPFQSRNGSRYTLGLQFVGGPLGGSVDYYRPTLEAVFYRPLGRRMAAGLRGQVGYVGAFGDTAEVPYYQRYFLGGETQIRGYNVRSVAPYDSKTKTSIGGDKFLLMNAEYYFDVLGPARLLLFFDAGQAYPAGQGFYWKTMSTSAGVELRFLMPVLNVPFRLIYALNPNRDFYQPAHAFKFAVGTTF